MSGPSDHSIPNQLHRGGSRHQREQVHRYTYEFFTVHKPCLGWQVGSIVPEAGGEEIKGIGPSPDLQTHT